MSDVHTVAVFCGAHAGHDPIFRTAATELGRRMARAGMRLVYGGGRIGLMGALADGASTSLARPCVRGDLTVDAVVELHKAARRSPALAIRLDKAGCAREVAGA